MRPQILVTGAAGNVGSEVTKLLIQQQIPVSVGIPAFGQERARQMFGEAVDYRTLDFEQPATLATAFEGIKKLFLVRPPQLADAQKYFAPTLEAAKRAGVEHIVFLSLIGAEKNYFVPHYKIEQLILASGLDWTFLRCSFFMQNLTTTHRPEIREQSELFVPAGQGRTSFIDVRDIAAVGVKALTEEGHRRKAYPLTGGEALDYYEVASLLSKELNRNVKYTAPGALAFLRRARAQRVNWNFALVMLGIYTTARFGMAGRLTPDTAQLLGRAPITMEQFIKDHRTVWLND